MKKHYQAIVLSIFVFIILCFLFSKLNTKQDKIEAVISAVVLENDTFQIFYRDSSDLKFTAKKSLTNEIKGDSKNQKIRFELPAGININSIRVDIGQNVNQKDVIIDEIILRSRSYEYIIKDSLLYYFKPNSFIKLGNDKNHFVPYEKQRANYNYDPYLTSIDISDIIKKLNQPAGLTLYQFVLIFIISSTFYFFSLNSIKKIKVEDVLESAFIISFLAIICIPYTYNKLNLGLSKDNIEKRELTKKPDFSFSKKYTKDFEEYFNENFGLRDKLIELGGRINVDIFNSSLNPENAIFGNNNWLFYNKKAAYKSYSNSNLLDEAELTTFVNTLEKRKINNEKNEIKYFFSFWPNKHTIYSEFLPFSMRIQKKDSMSKADQIIEKSKSLKSLKIIDVRDALIKEKKKHQIYYKNDTHWNSYGAFLAYQDFFKKAFTSIGIRPHDITDFDVNWVSHTQGDLIPLLGMKENTNFVELKPVFKFKHGDIYKQVKTPKGLSERTVITQNQLCNNNLKVVMFGDSFSINLIQFISLHFAEVIYLRSQYNQELVDKLKPNIIIDAHVERSL